MSNNKNFRVLISRENISHFYNILQFLGKIGKEVIIEVDTDVMTLRSLNDAKSAFASVELTLDFFQSYELRAPPGEVFACKMAIKPLCAVLKNSKKMQSLRLYNNLYNNVQDTGELEIIFAMACSHGILRTHRFIYQDTDIVNAMFDESSLSCSRMKCEPKVLAQLFVHISSRSIGEVSIEVTRNSFRVKTFHSDRRKRPLNIHDQSMSSILSSTTGKSHMTTEMCLDPRSEFEYFDYRGNRDIPQELIVCCKEIKSLLWLAEACEINNLDMIFTEGGRPIKLHCEIIPQTLNVTLIMATLEPQDSSSLTEDSTPSFSNTQGGTFTGREQHNNHNDNQDQDQEQDQDQNDEDEQDRFTSESTSRLTPATSTPSTLSSSNRTASQLSRKTSTQKTIKRKITSSSSSSSPSSSNNNNNNNNIHRSRSRSNSRKNSKDSSDDEAEDIDEGDLESTQTGEQSLSNRRSSGNSFTHSPGVAYLGGISRLKKMIMGDDEDD